MSCHTRWLSHAEERQRDTYREHERDLEMVARANGYSINDPVSPDAGITGYWDRRRKAEGDLAQIMKTPPADDPEF